MTNLDTFDIYAKLKESLDFVIPLADEHPKIFEDYVIRLLEHLPNKLIDESSEIAPDVGNAAKREQDDEASVTHIDKITAFLAENPWKSANEISEGAGVPKSIVGAVLYAKRLKGRFTSKTGDDDIVLWKNGVVGEKSRVGTRLVECKKPRVTTTSLIVDWLDQHGEGTIADIAKGIEDQAKSDTPDFTAVVRTIVSRSVKTGTIVRYPKDGTISYSLPAKPPSNKCNPKYEGMTTFEAIVAWSAENGHDYFTMSDVANETGRPISALRQVIYASNRELFDRISRKGPNGQTLFRFKSPKEAE
ncbi:MAG TPA: hypothetical protein DDX19_09590 [Rhodopirellula baltica]|uniref:Uncharacterized protein n=1 Tax=Rhodopirellula baltica (strain DSM 10527 / NCIMB 13988 / SH1) TaxID=243090 RepID=Q7UTV5_RHOBA|nr:hypothetical protein [Rhodopirellula baltica]CAD73329.1 hypothetical protein RB3661 [Rhodopirellula baltica SH 1]HBE62977.1 hypothetical protein [Rhodopirellula baltica]